VAAALQRGENENSKIMAWHGVAVGVAESLKESAQSQRALCS
jgi:hypothetical protein